MAVKELFWMLLVTVMATGAQLQQQSPEFPPALPPPPPPSASPLPPPSASPTTPSADDFRRSSGQSEEDGQQLTMMTLPSEDEGLVLASGQTAILECRISTAASSAGPASDGRNRNLSWTNSLTNRKMTTSDNSAFQNISLTHETSMESNETSLILTISNLTVAKSEFRCELDGDEDRSLQRTVKVTIISSDWFCTFEGETPCAWKIGTAWTREHSSPATNEPPSCSDGFSDHTYGKNNANGHFLIARVTGDRLLDGATLNLTGRNLTECIRFYYRTCVTNDSRGSVQLMLTMTKPVVSSPLLINLSLTLDWAEHSLMLPPQSQEQYEIMLTFTYTNASDFAYIAIDNIRMENENCDSGNQQVTKMESIGESSSLLQVPPVSTITTNTALTNTGSSPSSTSKVASTSKISSSTTITTTQSTTSFSPTPSTTTTTTTTAPTTGSSPSLPPTKMIQSTVIVSRWTSLLSATTKRKPDDSEDSIIHSTTDDDRISAPVAPAAAAVDEPEDTEEDEANDDAAAAAAATGDNSTGLAIGIILAIMVAGACTAAILYRRRKNGKKSTYITFGNPSYSREHLPVNDFGLDSPLTLSSNGYTVLA